MQVIREQEIAVVFAVPAQITRLPEIGSVTGPGSVERRQIVPYGQAFPRHGLLSTGRKGQQEYVQRDQNLPMSISCAFSKAARSVRRRTDRAGGEGWFEGIHAVRWFRHTWRDRNG